MQNRIEGEIKEGQSVVVIEDLVSTGKSSLQAVEALKERGCNIKGMAAIFTYGLEIADIAFAEAQIGLTTITNYDILISTAIKEKYITEKDIDSLRLWRLDPEKWSKDRM